MMSYCGTEKARLGRGADTFLGVIKWGYLGIKEMKMETTVSFYILGFRAESLGCIGFM